MRSDELISCAFCLPLLRSSAPPRLLSSSAGQVRTHRSLLAASSGQVIKAAMHLLRALLSTLVTYRPKESRSVPAQVWADPRWRRSHYTSWGRVASLAEVELEWCGPMAEGLRWAADLQARYLEEPVQLLRSFLRQERERRAGGASAAKAGSHGCSPVASADAAAGEGAVAGRQGSVLSRCMPSFVLNVFVLCVRERRCVCV